MNNKFQKVFMQNYKENHEKCRGWQHTVQKRKKKKVNIAGLIFRRDTCKAGPLLGIWEFGFQKGSYHSLITVAHCA